MTNKKDKQLQPPQIVVNITPTPLVDAPAYYVSGNLKYDERTALRLAWSKMNNEQGTKRVIFTVPDGVEIKTLSTTLLQQLRKQIDEALKERGAE